MVCLSAAGVLLQLQSLNKTYSLDHRNVGALRDVSLEMDAGEFIALQGKSGCGKSTLLLAAGGLLRPDGGRVVLDDCDLYAQSPQQRAMLRAEKIGFVFQQFHLIPYLDVLDNVLAATLGMPSDVRHASRERALEMIDHLALTHRIRHRPGELSTGERQRTALARALLNHPKLLLADEPTGNLDAENSVIVLEHLARFAQDGGAVLLATHSDQAARYAHRQLQMADGTIAKGKRPAP
jgi:ABC-type lipoprotein export system ATPase subunit